LRRTRSQIRGKSTGRRRLATLVPDPDFRLNPARAVFVHGPIEQSLVDRLIPVILKHQSQSRLPLSVYIDSTGGSVLQAEALLALLRASDQDFTRPCRIITAVTSFAASAAADLLSYGDYAIAFPQSTIHFHGVRTFSENAITVEAASGLMQSLKLNNDRYAVELASRSIHRFIFLYVSLRHQFPCVREELSKPHLPDLDCLLYMISTRLSPPARQVLLRANLRNELYAKLSTAIFRDRSVQALLNPERASRYPNLEAAVLRALVGHELKSNPKTGWTFGATGINQVVEKFFLFTEYLGHVGNAKLQEVYDRWGDSVVDAEEESSAAPPPAGDPGNRRIEKLRALLQPLWLFFVALCHSLQTGENTLSARDAYWLGLVDEVLGDPDLPSVRLLVEFQLDPSAAP
jgi:ATP-dependent protease ClpP protease subunit